METQSQGDIYKFSLHANDKRCSDFSLIIFLKKKKKLYGPYLWMGFNYLKASATSRRQFTFYH